MEKLSVKVARRTESIGKCNAQLQGWVRTRRDSKGGFSFLEINDGSCLKNIQAICDADLPNYADEIKRLTPGCSVSIVGQISESGGKGQATEIQVQNLTVLGWADPDDYPLQKKHHSFEKLREWAHLRARTNAIGSTARVRNCVCRSIHEFFQEEDFLYVHTPIITASDCEGAGEMFRVTTLDAAAKSVDYEKDFFRRPTYLTVSGQLNAEALACALGKVYTFGPTFRAENSNTSRHLAEFWMIEPEMAFCDLFDNMDIAERFLRRVITDVLGECQDEIEFFTLRVDESLHDKLKAVCDTEFLRLTYTEAIDILSRESERFEFPVKWGVDLQSEHERYLTEVHCSSPVFLYDYPRQIKPFYMRVNDDDSTVRAMDLLVPGVGEIIGGSQREERVDVLLARMKEQNLDLANYQWYVDLRRFGTVPHSGFGLGLERVIQFVTGLGNIRDVIPFPRTPGSADF